MKDFSMPSCRLFALQDIRHCTFRQLSASFFKMKIDCHVHLFCLSEESGGYTRLGPLYRWLEPVVRRKLMVQAARTPREREHLHIQRIAEQVMDSELDRATVLAFDQVYCRDGSLDRRRSRYYVPNRFAKDAVRSYPEALLFGASVHPYRADALEKLAEVKAEGAVLVKLLPNSHGFDPADPALRPYFRTLADLKLPLLLHGGFEHTIPVSNQTFGDPTRFRSALDAGVTLIVAHAGSAGRFHRRETFGHFLKLLDTYSNCFGDTAALAAYWRSKYLGLLMDPEALERRFGAAVSNPFERLIHGSDYPIPISPRAFGRSVPRTLKSTLGNRQNLLQADVSLKRLVGVPDSCLERAHDVLGLGHQGG